MRGENNFTTTFDQMLQMHSYFPNPQEHTVLC